MQIAESIFGHDGALQTRTQDISLMICDDQESDETMDITLDISRMKISYGHAPFVQDKP